jgi:hypothetical protein
MEVKLGISGTQLRITDLRKRRRFALYYSLDEFLKEFFGKVGPVHGSDYYIWIYVYEFPSGDEYFIAKISYDLISPFSERECFDEIKDLLLKCERNRPPKQGSKK